MDKAYKYAKAAIVNFKLDTCFCFAPIRIGLLIIGYFNLFIALLSLIGTADGGITAPLMEVQESLLEEDQVSKPAGIIAYACELGFSAVLLCAMYRSDIALLRVYIYFTMATVVTSVLMYSMVIAKVSMLTRIVIIGNIVFNCYVIILVRSAIVEIRELQSLQKNGHVVLYSVASVSHDDDDKKAIQIQPIADTNEHKKDRKVIEVLPIADTNENEDLKIEVINETLKKDNKIIAKESKKYDKIADKLKKKNKIGESKKNDKVDESQKVEKVGEGSKTSEKVDQTQAKMETVNEIPSAGTSVQ